MHGKRDADVCVRDEDLGTNTLGPSRRRLAGCRFPQKETGARAPETKASRSTFLGGIRKNGNQSEKRTES